MIDIAKHAIIKQLISLKRKLKCIEWADSFIQGNQINEKIKPHQRRK